MTDNGNNGSNGGSGGIDLAPPPGTGVCEGFMTGAVRDSQNGKPRYDLIPVEALYRLAMLYARGAIKYGENNWQKGIPYRRVYASLLRHVFAWAQGDTGEDHLAAAAWNAFTLMAYEEWAKAGRMPAELDDRNPLRLKEEPLQQP